MVGIVAFIVGILAFIVGIVAFIVGIVAFLDVLPINPGPVISD